MISRIFIQGFSNKSGDYQECPGSDIGYQPELEHVPIHYLDWWFEIFFIFTPKFGEDEPILTHIFQVGWFNHHLYSVCILNNPLKGIFNHPKKVTN